MADTATFVDLKEKNTAPVSTNSSVQVRSPIHSKSVGQWQRYGERGTDVGRKLREYLEF